MPDHVTQELVLFPARHRLLALVGQVQSEVGAVLVLVHRLIKE